MQILAWPGRIPDNPYTGLLYEQMEEAGAQVIDFSLKSALLSRPAIWHIHWPDKVLQRSSPLVACVRALFFFLLLHWARLRGTQVVWTVHNLTPHETIHPSLSRWFWNSFTRSLDSCILLSTGAQNPLTKRYPHLSSVPAFVIPHGHYRGAYPDTLSREAARSQLGIAADAPVIVSLGQIRPYKNVPHLIHCFRSIKEREAAPTSLSPQAVMLIAGKPKSTELAAEVRMASQGDDRVQLHLDFIPDERVQLYLRAADLAVLPYREILNSGSALLALSFDCPVLVPQKGAMGELQRELGSEWVHTYEGELTPEILEQTLKKALCRKPGVCQELNKLDWPLLAAKTLTSFQSLATRKGRLAELIQEL